ncbi:MAG: hypothetical protein AAGI45_15005 [Cyanobacteria bacterium P01_H01_bin.26]
MKDPTLVKRVLTVLMSVIGGAAGGSFITLTLTTNLDFSRENNTTIDNSRNTYNQGDTTIIDGSQTIYNSVEIIDESVRSIQTGINNIIELDNNIPVEIGDDILIEFDNLIELDPGTGPLNEEEEGENGDAGTVTSNILNEVNQIKTQSDRINQTITGILNNQANRNTVHYCPSPNSSRISGYSNKEPHEVFIPPSGSAYWGETEDSIHW